MHTLHNIGSATDDARLSLSVGDESVAYDADELKEKIPAKVIVGGDLFLG